MKEYKYTINGNKYEVAINSINDNIANVVVNGEEYEVQMEKEPEPAKKKVVVRPVAQPEAETASAPTSTNKVDLNNAVKSPLPGVITEIKVKVGDEVKAGDTVVVLEAMKMENDIVAPEDGTVASINAAVGSAVEAGETIATLN